MSEVGAGKTHWGAGVTLVGQLSKFAIQGASIAILSRIVSKGDFGVFTVVSSLTALAVLVGDFGLSFAAVQAKELTREQRSNLFWVNAALGVVLMLTMIVLSEYLAAIYEMPELASSLRLASVSFLILALMVQPKANLMRSMSYGHLAISDILSQAFGLAVAVAFALCGYGLIALVLQQLAAYAAQLVYLVAAGRWIPGLPNRNGTIRPMLEYGVNTLAGNLTNYASSNADRLALGVAVSAYDLGVYGRMQQLASLPVQQLLSPLSRVAVPTLSRMQDDRRHLENAIVDVQRIMAPICAFVTGTFLAFPEQVIVVVLGRDWIGGKAILMILAVGCFFQALGYVYYWIFLSVGRMDVQFQLGLIARAIGIAIVVVLARFGSAYVAVAVSGMLFLNWAVYGSVGMRRVGISGRRLLSGVTPSVVLFLIGGSVGMVSSWLAGGDLRWFPLSVALYLVCYLIYILFNRSSLVEAWARTGGSRGSEETSDGLSL